MTLTAILLLLGTASPEARAAEAPADAIIAADWSLEETKEAKPSKATKARKARPVRRTVQRRAKSQRIRGSARIGNSRGRGKAQVGVAVPF